VCRAAYVERYVAYYTVLLVEFVEFATSLSELATPPVVTALLKVRTASNFRASGQYVLCI